MLNGNVKITSNTNNIILFNNEYKKIVKDIMIKFLETIKTCNILKYYFEKEENESMMYKEWKYPNYCITPLNI